MKGKFMMNFRKLQQDVVDWRYVKPRISSCFLIAKLTRRASKGRIRVRNGPEIIPDFGVFRLQRRHLLTAISEGHLPSSLANDLE
jgi:hypothetical protein